MVNVEIKKKREKKTFWFSYGVRRDGGGEYSLILEKKTHPKTSGELLWFWAGSKTGVRHMAPA